MLQRESESYLLAAIDWKVEQREPELSIQNPSPLLIGLPEYKRNIGSWRLLHDKSKAGSESIDFRPSYAQHVTKS